MPLTRWPDLAVLELLTAVGRTGSLGAAARDVGMAQPNASRALRGLERDLGLPLLHRSPTGSRLTTQGLVLAEWAVKVLEPARQLGLAAESLASSARTRLRVCASRTVAEYFVPTWLTTLRAEQPDLQVTLHVENSEQVARHVREHECDLGLVEGPRPPTGLRTTVVGMDELVVVVAPTHPWARRRRPLTPAELAATPLVTREPGSGTRTTLDLLLAPHDPVAPALELESNEAVRISVASGSAPAVLSELAVESAVAAGQLVVVALDGTPATRRLRAVWTGPGPLHGPGAELVSIARRSGARRAAQRG